MQGEPVFRFETTDGNPVGVFPADRQDEASLHDLLERADPQNRLTTGRSQPSASSGAVACAVLDGYAWVAIVGDDQTGAVPVAVARFAPISDDQADVDVVVRDDVQGRGIGSRMLYFVLDQARAAGIRTASTSFESSNEAAWQVLQYSPYHFTWQSRGRQVDVEIHLQARTSVGTPLN